MKKYINNPAGADMTTGSLPKKIFLFSIPLIASQLLQVLFNMADVAVVGRFSSASALGSVGSTVILVTLFTGVLIGLGSGVNVRVAQFIGAKKSRDIRETVHASFVICLAAGIIIAVSCFLLAKPMLMLIKTKDELIDGAVLYFRIYALGMPALAIFNFGNAVLSAKGDTARPARLSHRRGHIQRNTKSVFRYRMLYVGGRCRTGEHHFAIPFRRADNHPHDKG